MKKFVGILLLCLFASSVFAFDFTFPQNFTGEHVHNNIKDDRWKPSHRYFLNLCRNQMKSHDIPSRIKGRVEEDCLKKGIDEWRVDCHHDIQLANIEKGHDTSSESPYCPTWQYPEQAVNLKSNIRREIFEFFRDYIAGKMLDKIIKDAKENYIKLRVGIEIYRAINRPERNDEPEPREKPAKKPDAHIGSSNPNWGMA